MAKKRRSVRRGRSVAKRAKSRSRRGKSSRRARPQTIRVVVDSASSAPVHPALKLGAQRKVF